MPGLFRRSTRRRLASTTTPSARRPLIENLECRQFLSASPLASQLAHAQHGHHAAQQPAVQDVALQAVAHTNLNVVATPDVTNTTPFGMTPGQARHAYGFDQITNDGSGQTIAIVDAYADPNIASDLNVFSNTFGLPQLGTGRKSNPKLTVVNQSTAVDSGWALETALDVEWAHAIAPRANIMLVSAASAGLGDLLSAVNYATSHGASVVSMSWGAGEFASETSYDSYFSHAGVAYVASSGDVGGAMSWPAASPNVLSVGGTNLRLNADNTVASETGWTGSGGGVSAYEAKPAYQSGVASATRSVPDVAYNADPNTGFAVYDSVSWNGTNSGWISVGGTSAGAPQWAALTALADQGRATRFSTAANLGGTVSLQKSIYDRAANDITDITANTNNQPAGANYASTGYDKVTGLGTPKAGRLVPDLKVA